MIKKIMKVLKKYKVESERVEYYPQYKQSRRSAVEVYILYGGVILIRDSEIELQDLTTVLDKELQAILKIQRLLK